MKISQASKVISADSICALAYYRIRNGGLKICAPKMIQSDPFLRSPCLPWDTFEVSYGFQPVDMLVFIAEICTTPHEKAGPTTDPALK